ncbi:MAG TPA: zinc ABC transporter substrate-binding protein [Candidatus Onthousia excrementipullorum]|uniref:Zinc ABC transporter substrate-binding protein n=1 Tax=Candidatus Onthousia excrementipullorum TaxID=2840884 RepID=A0A9D1DU44_9FIRM|nr:zinc ABC transporter substrate-binding protein [Candidatus Onthousia excrementipullorum]
MKRSVKNLGKIAFLGIAILLTTTGCKSDDMEDIEIVTTNYPNEYIIERLYGEHAKVSNIYPDGVDTSDYKFTNKQKRDFASKDLFIYTGLVDRERKLAVDLLDYNENLKIIDSSYVLDNDYDMEEVWLDPSFMLMMSQNVRLGLKEYIENNYLKEEIDKNYEELKVDISELDADIRLAVESAPYKTIVATDNNYKFLEKYGVKVYILNDDTSEKDLVEINDLVENGSITKIFSYKDIKTTNNVQNLINTYPNSLEVINSNRIIVLNDDQRETETDYLTLMNQNLDNIREELYHSNS